MPEYDNLSVFFSSSELHIFHGCHFECLLMQPIAERGTTESGLLCFHSACLFICIIFERTWPSLQYPGVMTLVLQMCISVMITMLFLDGHNYNNTHVRKK